MACQFVLLNHNLDYLTVCNCATPDILVIDGDSGKIQSRICSAGFTLGVKAEVDFEPLMVRVPVRQGDRIILFSNGAYQAQNELGEFFGQSGVEQYLSQSVNGHTCRESLIHALDSFCQAVPQPDDISFMEISCHPDIFPADESEHELTSTVTHSTKNPVNSVPCKNGWKYHFQLEGSRLHKVNPVPIIIAHLQELENLVSHRQTLFTILTELYVNAMDHGILKLDSSLKQSPEGFDRYFKQREKNLAETTDGWISFSLRIEQSGDCSRMRIRVEDSGSGFDSAININSLDRNEHYHGRGIMLLLELCESVRYIGCGNEVEVIYTWPN